MIESTPKFIQGIYAFTGAGFDRPVPLASYVVSADKRAQLIYMRAGNGADAMIALTLTGDGAPLRMFPLGAKAGQHVALAVVEDIAPETKLEIAVVAPTGVEGTIVLDFGLVEI